MLTETEYKKRRAGLLDKAKRAQEEYGASAMAESDDVEEKREAFETAQRNLERHDAAWEAGAKARHIAAKEEAEKQKQERARRMFNTVDAALSTLEQLAVAADAEAVKVGELSAQVQEARSAFFGSLAGLPLADRETLANMGQSLLKPERLQQLFSSVADRYTRYQLREENAVGQSTVNLAADIRRQAASIADVRLQESGDEPPARERVQNQERAKANPEDFGAVATESGFWIPGVKFHPPRVPHELPAWSRPVPTGEG